MTQSMKKNKMGRQLGQEFRAAMRLSPLALVALLLVVLLWRSDSAANSGLFQSSIVETPTFTATVPTIEVTVTVPGLETQTPTPGASTPTTEATSPAATATFTPVPLETATAQPSLTPELTLTPPPELTPGGTVSPTATVVTGTVSPEPSPSGEASATPDDRERYPEGESNLAYDWGMLFDSVSLFLSYAWLCCGVLAFIAVPVVFIVLWVASKRRQQPEEE